MNGDDLIEKVLREGEMQADEVEVFYARGQSISAGIKKGILGTAEESETWSMTIRAVRDGRIGFSSTSDPDRVEGVPQRGACKREDRHPAGVGRAPETGRHDGHRVLGRPGPGCRDRECGGHGRRPPFGCGGAPGGGHRRGRRPRPVAPGDREHKRRPLQYGEDGGGGLPRSDQGAVHGV